MTLQRRLRLASLALSISLVVAFLLGVATLWKWAYHFGELAFLPASIQSGPLSVAILLPLWFLAVMAALTADFQCATHAMRFAALSGHVDAAPLARKEYGEGAPPERLPVMLQWRDAPNLTGLLLVVPTYFWPLVLAFNAGIDYLAKSAITGERLALSVAFVLPVIGGLLACLSLLLWGIRVFRRPMIGVIADEQGIRQWTLRGESPKLAWRDLRLLDVSGTPVEENPRYGLRFRVYDVQGCEVSWVLAGSSAAEYLSAGATGEEALAAARGLVWLARMNGLLVPRTIHAQLASVAEDARLGEMRQALGKSLFCLFAALLAALLAVGVLPFHGLLFPALNIASAVCLTLFALALLGGSAWLWLGLQRQWFALAERSTRSLPPALSRRALLAPSLALVGGALGWLAVYSAPAVGGAPVWLLGDFLMLAGMPAVTVIGWLLARRAWRRLRRGQSPAEVGSAPSADEIRTSEDRA
jgi:hypothetical protein